MRPGRLTVGESPVQAYSASFAPIYNLRWGDFACVQDLNNPITDPENESRVFFIARK